MPSEYFMNGEFDIDLLHQALSLGESEFDSFLEECYNSFSRDQELSKSVYLKMGKHRDPRGGLTKEGIEYYNRKTGSNLKPGVTWKPRTAEDFRRKGSFLVRFYANPVGPLVNEKGELTRLAKAARAWGEHAPTTLAAAAKLAAKGRRLLEKAKRMKESRKRVKASLNSIYEEYSIPSKNPDDYLVVEDRDKVSTYHLQVKENGVPNPRLMGAAWRALYHPSGHRGNPYKGPQKDKAKRKLRALYKALGRKMPRVQRHSLFSCNNAEPNETRQELSRLRTFIYNLVEKPLKVGTKIQSPVLRKLTSTERVDSNLASLDTDTSDYQEGYHGSNVDLRELLSVLEDNLSQLVSSDKYSNCSKETLELALSISKDIILSLLGLDLSESDFTDSSDEGDYYLLGSDSDGGRISVLNTDSCSLEEVDLPDGFVFLTSVDRDCILRKYTFNDYSHAISFVNDIYNKSEEIGHHPIELLTIYNSPITEVYVKLSTNDEQVDDIVVEYNTVTQKDIKLAHYCNSIYKTHYKSGLSNSGSESLSNSDDIELTNYYIDQLNMALSDLKLSKEINLDDYESYSESIFLDKDKHQQAKQEAKSKFRVYPSAYANMWMVKRYKELGGRFADRD
jgi:pterin-4a-carbinolamine dehydratase